MDGSEKVCSLMAAGVFSCQCTGASVCTPMFTEAQTLQCGFCPRGCFLQELWVSLAQSEFFHFTHLPEIWHIQWIQHQTEDLFNLLCLKEWKRRNRWSVEECDLCCRNEAANVQKEAADKIICDHHFVTMISWCCLWGAFNYSEFSDSHLQAVCRLVAVNLLDTVEQNPKLMIQWLL